MSRNNQGLNSECYLLLVQSWFDVGTASQTLNQHWGQRLMLAANRISRLIPVSTKHLYSICTMLGQRRRRCADVVQMLFRCFVSAEMSISALK